MCVDISQVSPLIVTFNILMALSYNEFSILLLYVMIGQINMSECEKNAFFKLAHYIF